MSNTPPPTQKQTETTGYEIRIKGHLSERWASWSDGLTVTLTFNRCCG